MKRLMITAISLVVLLSGVWPAAAQEGGKHPPITLENASQLAELESYDVGVITVRNHAISPDGRSLVAISNGVVMAWDLTTGSQQFAIPGEQFFLPVQYSPDGTRLALAEDRWIHMWDAATGENLADLENPDYVWGLAFSPDGKTLAAFCTNASVQLWDAATGEKLGTLTGLGQDIYQLAFSPDSKTLAAGGWDGTVVLWDLPEGSVRTTWTKLTKVNSLAFSPDGRVLVLSGNVYAEKLTQGEAVGQTLVLDVATGSTLADIQNKDWFHTGGAIFTPDGSLFITYACIADSSFQCVKSDLLLIDAQQWTISSTLEIDTISNIALSGDGSLLATSYFDSGQVQLWGVP